MSRSPRRMRPNPLRSSIAAAVERLEGRVLLSTYTVTNLNDSGPGSLRDEIQQANAHVGADTVNFTPGLIGTVALTSGSLSISDDLDVVGPGAGIIGVSGMNTSTVFEVGARGAGISVAMSGLTITGGHANDAQSAGGINNLLSAHLTLNACAFIHNQGSAAGAIYNPDASFLDVTNCTFSQNDALGVAAIYNFHGSVTIANSTFSGNAGSANSEVIADEGGTMTILDSTISGNTNGVGIKDGEGLLTVMNTTISGITGDGGALNNYCAMVHCSLVNCTLTGNKVAVYDYDGIAALTNCTITGNGTGVIADGDVFGETRVSLANTIVAANDNDIAVPGQASNVAGSNNLIGTGGSGGLVNGQNGNIVGVGDPLLAPLGNYGGPTQTMPPLVGSLATAGSSPAIDGGSNALAVGPDGQPLTTDQRGYPRVYNGKVDIGAAEFGFAAANPVVTNLNDSGPGSLMQAILDTNIRIGPDTITFAPGLTGTIPGYEPTITDNLTIAGPGASVLAVGGGFSLDVYASTSSPLSQAALNASGLTINGEISDPYPPGTSITLTDCTLPGVDSWGSLVIRRCTISGGRGILANGLFDISDSTISNCASGAGDVAGDTAAIIVPRGGGGYLTHCTITANPGDGIWTTSGIVTLTRCTVSDNKADGMYTDDENIEVIDSTVSGNGSAGISGTSQASFGVFGSTIANNKGSGITYSGQLRLNNSTVANNMGGGIDVTGGLGTVLLRVTNSTIVGNVGTNVGGVSVGGGAVINNTIVAGNRDANGASDLVAFHPVTGSNDLIGAGGSGGLVNGQNGNIVGVADPKLAPLGNYGGPTQTMPPLAGSPAIDAGSNALAVDANGKPLVSDQRGYYRIVNGKVDIGSVEFNSTPLVPGDINGDGKVDVSDLLILAQNYGTQHDAGWSAGDFTGDGAVNFDDLLLLAQHFGKTRPAAAARR